MNPTHAHGPINRRLYFYAAHAPRARPPGTDPAPDRGALALVNVEGIAKMAMVFFSLPLPPLFGWNETDAWLDIAEMVMPSAFPDVPAFIDALPELEDWLAAWSTSADRQPDLAPSWAARFELAPSAVDEIARGIEAQLAKSTVRKIAFSDAQGQSRSLTVPPTAALSLPRVQPFEDGNVRVATTQRAATYENALGQQVAVMYRDATELARLSPHLRIPSRLFRRQRLKRVDAMRIQDDET